MKIEDLTPLSVFEASRIRHVVDNLKDCHIPQSVRDRVSIADLCYFFEIIKQLVEEHEALADNVKEEAATIVEYIKGGYG